MKGLVKKAKVSMPSGKGTKVVKPTIQTNYPSVKGKAK
jgi:hypothetical protein